MDTRLLKMFCAVARSGSLANAARELHITPSAVSHALKALEGQLGCLLLDRVGKRVYLNQAGEQLLSQIRKPLSALNAAEEEIKRLGQWGQSRLRIGASATACQYILPDVIRELKKSTPKISIQLKSGDMPEMLGLLEENKIDLALGVEPANTTHLASRLLFKDELLFAFPPSHPWASAKSVPRHEISSQPLILYHQTSVTADLVDDYFRTLDVSPQIIMEIASIEAIKQLVCLGLGVGIIAPWTAQQELKKGLLEMRPLGSRPLSRPWGIVHLASRRLNLVEETFCRLCEKHTSRLPVNRRDI